MTREMGKGWARLTSMLFLICEGRMGGWAGRGEPGDGVVEGGMAEAEDGGWVSEQALLFNVVLTSPIGMMLKLCVSRVQSKRLVKTKPLRTSVSVSGRNLLYGS